MSLRVLVVDDTKFMRMMLTDIIKRMGHEVVGQGENGKQAVQQYMELKPDITFLDITMPEMDGIEALREIHKINPEAAILICSAMSQEDLISEALKAGANGYVLKPFVPNKVRDVLDKVVPLLHKKENLEPLEEEVQPEPVVETTQTIEQPAAEVKKTTKRPAFKEHEYLIKSTSSYSESAVADEQPVQVLTLDPEEVQILSEEIVSDAVITEAEIIHLDEPAVESVEVELMDDASVEHEFSIPETDDTQDGVFTTIINHYDELQEENSEFIMSQETMNKENQFEDIINEVSNQWSAVEEPMIKAQQHSEASATSETSNSGETKINVVKEPVKLKNFTSSFMCNWNEELDGEDTRFLVICTEVDQRIRVEMMNKSGERQTVFFSLDGMTKLVDWLTEKSIIQKS